MKNIKIMKTYYNDCMCLIETTRIKSMTKLNNLFKKNYGDIDLTAPYHPKEVMTARFTLYWERGGCEFTSLFCVLKNYKLKGRDSWFYKKMKKGNLFIVDWNNPKFIKEGK
jgi:hypothetical protein